MSQHLKLDKPPMFVMHYPTCSTCGVDLDTEGDGWTCSSCGTNWDMTAGDGDEGELYAYWSGEEIDGPALTERQAESVAQYRERLDNHRRHGDKYPNLFPRPLVPSGLPEGFLP